MVKTDALKEKEMFLILWNPMYPIYLDQFSQISDTQTVQVANNLPILSQLAGKL